MSYQPEVPDDLSSGVFVAEETQAFVLDQADLEELYYRIKDSLPMVVSAADGDFGDDGSIAGGGNRTVDNNPVVCSLETRFLPFGRSEGASPWRHIGSLIERMNIGHELGEELATREFKLLWDGGSMFDLTREGSESGVRPDDVKRLLGYFSVTEQNSLPQAA